MKLKKILSGALSASMLISCMSFGGGTVVQATTERGENIAEASQIISHSGNDGIYTIDHVMDGEGNDEQDNHERWLSKIRLKGNEHQTGDAAYIVYDLGENGPRSYEGLHIRFHNQAYATDYKVYTSDKNTYTENEMKNLNPEQNGWTELDHKIRQSSEYRRYPLDTRPGQTNTGRYLLFYFSQMRTDLSGVSDSISIREIEIYHKPIDSITLPETLELEVDATSQLTATILPEDATYQDVTWSSEDPDKVAVSEDGIVTAKAEGTVVITATCKDDKTKTATCRVTVAPNVNKNDLAKVLEEARALTETDYTEASWSILQEAVTEADRVYQAQDSTQGMVDDAAATVREAINGLVRVYKVTVVNGDDVKVVASGEYGKFVTVTAPKAPAGQIFAGWKNGEVTVSTKESYSFYLVGNVTLTATYQSADEEIVQNPGAMLSNVLFRKTAENKYRVSFVCQLSVPDGYELHEAGIFWSKTEMSSLHNGDGTAVSGARKVNARSTNRQYQYTIDINNVPSGYTLYQEVFAKVKNKATGEFSWVYTTVKSVTVP